MNIQLNVYVSGTKVPYGEVPENVALGIINATLVNLIRDDDAELEGYQVYRKSGDSIELHLDLKGTTEFEKDRNMALVTNTILQQVIELVYSLSAD